MYNYVYIYIIYIYICMYAYCIAYVYIIYKAIILEYFYIPKQTPLPYHNKACLLHQSFKVQYKTSTLCIVEYYPLTIYNLNNWLLYS